LTAPTCLHCHKAFSLERFLDAVSAYSTVTDSGDSTCPECGGGLEFRVANGSLELGYTYWAGSLHFEGISVFESPDLRRVSSGSSITISHNGRSFVRAT